MASTPRFVETYLGYLLGQANHALFKDLEPDVRAAGLSSIEWRVLATLSDVPSMTVSALAREVLSKQPTVTKLVQRMSEQGWLALRADEADHRCTLVSATPAGKRKVRTLLSRAREREALALSTLSPQEIERLRDLLTRLLRPTST